MFLEEGLAVPADVHTATDEYRRDVTFELDSFFNENLAASADARSLKTSELHRIHVAWARKNGLPPMTTYVSLAVMTKTLGFTGFRRNDMYDGRTGGG